MSQDLRNSTSPMMQEMFKNTHPKFDKDIFDKEVILKAFKKERESDKIVSFKKGELNAETT